MPKKKPAVSHATPETFDAESLDFDDNWQRSSWRSRLRQRLLAWFDVHARSMPWRSDPQPYKVWVSEIMLQQTQVATVMPYFHRWMEAFPDIQSLAAADIDELMRHWEGLGYYRRVKSMHAAAQQIVDQHGGQFPADYDSVLALPGVGRYTAGAVLSISGDARLPVLEGNTQRVYSRWIGLRQTPTDKQANKLLWHFAETMLPQAESGRFNQAAMELGALVCTPRQPKCETCPVRSACSAAKHALQDVIPGKIKRLEYQDRTEFALIVSRPPKSVTTAANGQQKIKKRAVSQTGANTQTGEQEFLVRPLPDGGRWAGLWDFPRLTDAEMESVDHAAHWLSKQLETPLMAGVRLATIRHAVTKYRISLHVHQVLCRAEEQSSRQRLADIKPPGILALDPPEPWNWKSLKELEELPMSVSGRKIVRHLQTQQQSFLPLAE